DDGALFSPITHRIQIHEDAAMVRLTLDPSFKFVQSGLKCQAIVDEKTASSKTRHCAVEAQRFAYQVEFGRYSRSVEYQVENTRVVHFLHVFVGCPATSENGLDQLFGRAVVGPMFENVVAGC